MRAALDNLGNTKIEPRGGIAVLGDMRELGRDSETYHLDIAQPILKNQVEKIFTVGNQMERLFLAPRKCSAFAASIERSYQRNFRGSSAQ